MPNAPLRFLDATHVRFAGHRLLYVAGCNYLGLSWHPEVRQALARAAEDPMLQPGASRATTGEQTYYRQFEQRLIINGPRSQTSSPPPTSSSTPSSMTSTASRRRRSNSRRAGLDFRRPRIPTGFRPAYPKLSAKPRQAVGEFARTDPI